MFLTGDSLRSDSWSVLFPEVEEEESGEGVKHVVIYG